MKAATCLGLFLLALCPLPACCAVDYYKILQVDRSASIKDIKKQYRKLSKKYHPDKSKEKGAKDRFLEVSQAFEVLSDDNKRKVYDRHGEEGLKRMQNGQSEGHSPFDMFRNFFGGGGGRQERKTPNMVTEVVVELADLYTGKTFDFEINVRRICHHCDGSGAHSPKDIVDCPHCQGQGIVVVRQQLAPGMFTQMQQHCPHCQGRGRTTKRLCPICSGQRVTQTTNSLSLSIDRGLPEDSEITFEGEADEAPDYEPGDVIVRVKSKADDGGFTRKGPHLYYKQAIGIDEALLGFERKVKGLDGHWLSLKRQGTTQPGFTQIVKEEGMPHYHLSGFGNLYVEYSVVLPTSLDKATQAKLSEAFNYPEKANHSEL